MNYTLRFERSSFLLIHFSSLRKFWEKRVGVFAKTNPQLEFNPKLIPKLESNAKLT